MGVEFSVDGGIGGIQIRWGWNEYVSTPCSYLFIHVLYGLLCCCLAAALMASVSSSYATEGPASFSRVARRWIPGQDPLPSTWEGRRSATGMPVGGCTPRGCVPSGSRRRTRQRCRSESASVRPLWSRSGCEAP